MPEWLNGSIQNAGDAPLEVLAVRIVLAAVLGAVVAAVYVATQRKPKAEVTSLATTLVLLTVLIAMVTLVIGNSVARAFSLAGALAIIRFRTVVEDTRDTAFVIFAVVVGMGVGAGYVLVPVIGIPVVAVAAFLLGTWGRAGVPVVCDATLAVRIGLGRDPAGLFGEVFETYLVAARLQQTATARQGAALDLTYAVRLRPGTDAVALVTALNQLDGVQTVELRQT